MFTKIYSWQSMDRSIDRSMDQSIHPSVRPSVSLAGYLLFGVCLAIMLASSVYCKIPKAIAQGIR